MLHPIKVLLAYAATTLSYLARFHQGYMKTCIPCLSLHGEFYKYALALVVTPLAFLPMGSVWQVYRECFHPAQVFALCSDPHASYP